MPFTDIMAWDGVVSRGNQIRISEVTDTITKGLPEFHLLGWDKDGGYISMIISPGAAMSIAQAIEKVVAGGKDSITLEKLK